MVKLEIGSATAIASVAAFSIHSVYTQHAGKLSDARQAEPGNPEMRAAITDADVLTGSLVLVVGGTLAAVTKKVEPLALAVAVFGITSFYYHRACEGTY